ncbi:MAG TPA: NADH-quinone oxidoreductase subunit C [Vicinamibacterales bacterium]|nr:NADH-quinone oxidoreductase subunit C [Vicinamibacterales bacterium]
MDANAVVEVLLREQVGDPSDVEAVAAADGMPTIRVAPGRVVEVGRVLRDAPDLRFNVLVDLTAVDFHPREPRFELVYLLLCTGAGGSGDVPKRLRMKVLVAGAIARVPTVSGIWPVANWAEREVYDFFGVEFEGHPDPRRILMPEDWEGFPLRKDYPVQIKTPVKTYEPLQLSEQEFLANMQAARSRPPGD